MKSSFASKIGWLLLLLACVCWLFILAIPFIFDGVGRIAGVIAVAVVLGEVLFWLGTLLVGKEVFTHFKNKLFSNSKNSNKMD